MMPKTAGPQHIIKLTEDILSAQYCQYIYAAIGEKLFHEKLEQGFTGFVNDISNGPSMKLTALDLVHTEIVSLLQVMNTLRKTPTEDVFLDCIHCFKTLEAILPNMTPKIFHIAYHLNQYMSEEKKVLLFDDVMNLFTKNGYPQQPIDIECLETCADCDCTDKLDQSMFILLKMANQIPSPSFSWVFDSENCKIFFKEVQRLYSFRRTFESANSFLEHNYSFLQANSNQYPKDEHQHLGTAIIHRTGNLKRKCRQKIDTESETHIADSFGSSTPVDILNQNEYLFNQIGTNRGCVDLEEVECSLYKKKRLKDRRKSFSGFSNTKENWEELEEERLGPDIFLTELNEQFGSQDQSLCQTCVSNAHTQTDFPDDEEDLYFQDHSYSSLEHQSPVQRKLETNSLQSDQNLESSYCLERKKDCESDPEGFHEMSINFSSPEKNLELSFCSDMCPEDVPASFLDSADLLKSVQLQSSRDLEFPGETIVLNFEKEEETHSENRVFQKCLDSEGMQAGKTLGYSSLNSSEDPGSDQSPLKNPARKIRRPPKRMLVVLVERLNMDAWLEKNKSFSPTDVELSSEETLENTNSTEVQLSNPNEIHCSSTETVCDVPVQCVEPTYLIAQNSLVEKECIPTGKTHLRRASDSQIVSALTQSFKSCRNRRASECTNSSFYGSTSYSAKDSANIGAGLHPSETPTDTNQVSVLKSSCITFKDTGVVDKVCSELPENMNTDSVSVQDLDQRQNGLLGTADIIEERRTKPSEKERLRNMSGCVEQTQSDRDKIEPIKDDSNVHAERVSVIDSTDEDVGRCITRNRAKCFRVHSTRQSKQKGKTSLSNSTDSLVFQRISSLRNSRQRNVISNVHKKTGVNMLPHILQQKKNKLNVHGTERSKGSSLPLDTDSEPTLQFRFKRRMTRSQLRKRQNVAHTKCLNYTSSSEDEAPDRAREMGAEETSLVTSSPKPECQVEKASQPGKRCRPLLPDQEEQGETSSQSICSRLSSSSSTSSVEHSPRAKHKLYTGAADKIMAISRRRLNEDCLHLDSEIKSGPRAQRSLKTKWTAFEEEKLVAGVLKYGEGHWKKISHQYKLQRSSRNMDDKWRNVLLSHQLEGIKARLKNRKTVI